MKKIIRRYLPSHAAILRQRWLKPFAAFLAHHNLWYLHRRGIAGGVAIGLFCGLVPGPFQMMSATLLAILFRVNLPVAVLMTVYTNPLTIVPLYWLAYQMGAWVMQVENGRAQSLPDLPEWSWHAGWEAWWHWFVALGEPLLLGLLLLASVLALLGYVLVRVGWRLWVMYRWQQRKAR